MPSLFLPNPGSINRLYWLAQPWARWLPRSYLTASRIQLLRNWAAVVLPQSAGTVGLKSRDPRITPAIEYNLLAEFLDRRLLEAMKLARCLARTAPFADFIYRAGSSPRPRHANR